MKKRKRFLAPLLSLSILGATGMVITACNNDQQVASKLTKLSIRGTPKTEYRYGDAFERPTVIAQYSDGEKVDVTEDCTVSGFSSYKVGGQTVTLSYMGKSVSYNVTVTDEVCGISVSGYRTTFEQGEEFSLGGAKVYLVYDSGRKVEADEYDISNEGTDVAGTFNAVVSVPGYDFSFSYQYTVVASSSYTAVSIAFTNIQTEYEVGDGFVRPTATITDSNEQTHDVSNFVTYTGFDSSTAGTKTVTGSYKGVSNTFDVVVSAPEEGGTADIDIPEDTISKAFSLTNDTDGVEITPVNGVYTIDATQTKTKKDKIAITAVGKLEKGQIEINAPDSDVELTLNGVSIHNNEVCPIHVTTCDDLEISAKNKSSNYLYDDRTTAVVDEENDQYGGAIFVEDGDLKLKGKGQLKLVSYSNNGVHAKDDVTIKNLALVINAVNNGVKGNDSVTFEEAPKVKIECGNDGIKSTSTDLNKDNEQRGNVSILGGEIEIQSYGDAIDAAYDLIIQETEVIDEETGAVTETYTPILDVYTYTYSSFKPANYGVSASFYSDNSKKGLKSTHDIAISGGSIYVKAYDDAIHGNKYTTVNNVDQLITYETGASAVGDVTISGGSLELYSDDDGIHADSTLTISGGNISVTHSYEGLEGHTVNVTGGETYVIASDDGVNATSTNERTYDGQINVSGGYLDVTVPGSNDRDGIDSNGTYTQTGGIVVVRGPASGGAWSLDTDSTCTLNGGTIVVVGGIEASSSNGGGWFSYRPGPGGGGGGPGGGSATLVVGSNMSKTTSNTGKSIGTFRVTAGSTVSFTYTNTSSYSGSVIIYSDAGTPSITNA